MPIIFMASTSPENATGAFIGLIAGLLLCGGFFGFRWLKTLWKKRRKEDDDGR